MRAQHEEELRKSQKKYSEEIAQLKEELARSQPESSPKPTTPPPRLDEKRQERQSRQSERDENVAQSTADPPPNQRSNFGTSAPAVHPEQAKHELTPPRDNFSVPEPHPNVLVCLIQALKMHN